MRAQGELGVTFPESLFSFLQATNGFTDLASRSLLAFGGDGAGGWFCLSLDASGESPIFHWNWIDGEARRIAVGLAGFRSGWLDGSVSI